MTEPGAVRLTDLRKRYGLGRIGDAALAHSTAIGNAVLVLAAWSAVLALVGARRYRASLTRA